MDYYSDPTLQYPFERPTCQVGRNPVIPYLEHVFDPSGTKLSVAKDCILISLDVEYECCTQRIHQIGLASLDTRVIQKADHDKPIHDLISSRLLMLETQRRCRGAYLFGRPEKQHNGCPKNLLLPCFTIVDTKDPTKLRNIILVGHGIRADIDIIQSSSGLKLLELPTIKAVVDTSPLINKIFHFPGYTHSLTHTCRYLGMYRRNMHNAGNDAMYTLKALLLLFYHYKGQKIIHEIMDKPTDMTLLYECQLEAIKRIGRYNNGISRFRKKRERIIMTGTLSIPREQKSWDLDLLDLEDGVEEAVVDFLFGSA